MRHVSIIINEAIDNYEPPSKWLNGLFGTLTTSSKHTFLHLDDVTIRVIPLSR